MTRKQNIWRSFASAILFRAITDAHKISLDEFVNSDYCRDLCYIADIDYRKYKMKYTRLRMIKNIVDPPPPKKYWQVWRDGRLKLETRNRKRAAETAQIDVDYMYEVEKRGRVTSKGYSVKKVVK